MCAGHQSRRVAMVASAAPAAGAGTGPSQQAQTCSSFCYKTFLLRVQPQSENSFRYTRTSMSLFKVGWEQMHKTLNLTLTSKQNGSFFSEFIYNTYFSFPPLPPAFHVPRPLGSAAPAAETCLGESRRPRPVVGRLPRYREPDHNIGLCGPILQYWSQ